MKIPILIILPSLQIGGVELQTIHRIQELQKNNLDVHLLLLHPKTKLLSSISINPSKIYQFNYPYDYFDKKTFIYSLLSIRKLIAIIQKNNIQLIIAHLFLSHFIARAATFIMQKLYNKKIKLINYHHTLLYEVMPLTSYAQKIFNRLQQTLANTTDTANICVSNAVLQNLNTHFKLKNPIVIHNYIIFKNVESTQANNYLISKNLHNKQYLILLPGRLHAIKGHLFFLDAFSKIINKYNFKPENILAIFAGGAGNQYQKIIQKINLLHLNNFIHITGVIDNNLMLSLFKVSHLIVIPSVNEALGNVAIESLMLQRLTLCSNSGGLPEIIKHEYNGFVFEKLNETDFIEKFCHIYNNKHTLLIPQKNMLNSYNQYFSPTIYMQQLLTVINHALNK